MAALAVFLLALPSLLGLYAYVIYPIALRVAAARREPRSSTVEPAEWPTITVVVVAHNAEHSIGDGLERLLATDYPEERRQIIVVSDASTDGTERVVAQFASRGVELHSLNRRVGKTAAENSIADRIRGRVVVAADASVHVAPGSIKALVATFTDPTVGVASGRAVGVPRESAGETFGDAAYYSYEMWVRSLEAHFGAVIGATGGLYAVRRELFAIPLPPHATRDFATPLLARESGLRSVIVDDAVCFVRQTPSLRREFHRKVRTMVRGLDTLYEFRHLMDPMRHGGFAVMLVSHKLCRWLVYLLAPLAAIGLALLALESWPARAVAAVALLAGVFGLAAVTWPPNQRVPRLLAACGYALVGGAAGAAAWSRFLRGEHMVVWEPTRRG